MRRFSGIALWCALLAGAVVVAACGDDERSTSRSDAGPARTDAGHDSAVLDIPDAARADATSVSPKPDAGRDAALPPEDAGDDDAGVCGRPLTDTIADGGGYIAPATLADTGLYADPVNEVLAEGVEPFEPAYKLWSDGASKRRYLYLPPCTQIDTSDMNHWVFPVGTKAWKEFTRDGIRVETRMLEKTPHGWYMVAFIWNHAQTKAVAAPSGMTNANGTQHDVPPSATCLFCHNGEVDRLLGVSAIQLSHHKPGLNLDVLIARGRLSKPPKHDFVLPGSAIDQAALGALHANCGHCHNPHGAGWDVAAGMQLQLEIGKLGSVTATPTYTTTVDHALTSKTVPGATQRIVRGQPDQSALLLRLQSPRGTGNNDLVMPPIATELDDDATATAVRTWITSLTP